MEYRSVGPGRPGYASIVCVLAAFSGLLQIQNVNGAVDWSRHQNKTVAFACEDSTMYLLCGENEVIRIIRANYGRFSISICNAWGVTEGWNLRCMTKDSSTRVKERCDGRRACRLTASNAQFGDPCKDTVKYLETHYYCEKTATPSPKPPTTTSSTTSSTSRKASTRHTTFSKAATLSRRPFTTKPPIRPTRPTRPTHPTRPSGPIWTRWPVTLPHITQRPLPNVNIKHCLTVEKEGVYWPSISAGFSAERPCPNGRAGRMSWRCGKNGKWRGNPDLSQCVSAWVKNIEDLFKEDVDVDKVADEIVQKTGSNKLWPGDLKRTAESLLPKLRNVVKSQVNAGHYSRSQRKETMEKLSQAVVQTGSNLLSEKQSDSWKTLPAWERSKVVTSLVVGMEETGFEIADALEADQSVTTLDDNILMEVNAMTVTEDAEGDIQLPSANAGAAWHQTKDKITISRQNLQKSSKNGVARVVFLVYNNLDEWMKPGNEEGEKEEDEGENEDMKEEEIKVIGDQGQGQENNAADQKRNPEPYVNSRVFSASINNSSRNEPQLLKKPFVFTMNHIKPQLSDNFSPSCVFWEYDKSQIGHWSRDGCIMVSTNDTHTVCQCNHLTNFAVLMDVTGTKLTPEHQISLRAITIVGCTVSIICLACSFFTFCFFKNLQCDRNTIHKNLVFTLMLAELIFVVAIEFTWNKVLCAVVAGLLHFLFLAAFGWMCLEGVQLYVMLIEVFDPGRTRSLYYYLCGYGIPAVIVGISAGIKPSGYGTKTHCWLSTENGLIWSFVGPVAAVILVNIVMLSIAVYMMCKHANTLASNLRTKEKSRLQKISRDPSSSSSGNSMLKDTPPRMHSEVPAWLKGAAVLVFLLGLTWAFGIMYINEASIPMAYIFTICNSLQGLFIFIFHCLLNEKVKKEYKKLAYRSTWLPSCFRDLCIGYSSTSNTRDSSSSGGHLLKFWSGRRRRKSSNSTYSTPPKGNKRKSDPDSYSSRDNNTTYTHGGSNRQSGGSSRQNGRKSNGHTNGHVPHHREMDGIAGDLSVADCSVIDSEFVSEYCNNNLQVSRERRYSSGSEDANHMLADEATEKERHRLSALSSDSALKHGSEFASSVDIEAVEPFYNEIPEGSAYKDPRHPDGHHYEQCAPLLPPQTETEQNIINTLLSHYNDDRLPPRQYYKDYTQGGSPYRPQYVSGDNTPEMRVNHSTPNTKHIHRDNCNNSIGTPDVNVDMDGTQDLLLGNHYSNSHPNHLSTDGQVDSLPNYTYSTDSPPLNHRPW